MDAATPPKRNSANLLQGFALALLDIGGGMPTRVSVPEKRLPDAIERIKRALADRA